MLDDSTSGETSLGAVVTQRVMLLRLATGLAQGLLLYWLYVSSKSGVWPATEPYLIVPLLFAGTILPVLLISGMGHMATRSGVRWILFALVLMLLLAAHDVWRGAESGFAATAEHKHLPSVYLGLFGAGFFYIAHALALAGAQEGRFLARYTTYFETAWKLLIQLKFSALFALALWLVLWLGSALFMLVNLHFLRDLLRESWFAVPVICIAFSWAMHITDVRPAIVRGIRTLLLVLMSWILPLAALLMTGFMCALPFTGMETLWATRHATSVLLAADAVLLVLINAAYQNGEAGGSVAGVVRASARAASVLLLPLTVIAIYALGLRVHEYGWTSDRVIAAACLLVASCYAAGYMWAAYGQGGWLDMIAPVNVAAAFLVLAVLLALFSPVADPARIAVDSQMARLAKGRVTADKLDYRFLRFDSARYGREALQQLAAGAAGPDAALLRERAALALKETNRYSPALAQHPAPLQPVSIAANLHVWPAGAVLPAGFVNQRWDEAKDPIPLPLCLRRVGEECNAVVLDLDGDGQQEVLIFDEHNSVPMLLARQSAGEWSIQGTLPYGLGRCKPLLDKLKAGDFKLVPSRVRDLEVGGRHIAILPRDAASDICGALN